jgi:hypothetical protein
MIYLVLMNDIYHFLQSETNLNLQKINTITIYKNII